MDDDLVLVVESLPADEVSMLCVDSVNSVDWYVDSVGWSVELVNPFDPSVLFSSV